jgi:hypothetical protein
VYTTKPFCHASVTDVHNKAFLPKSSSAVAVDPAPSWSPQHNIITNAWCLQRATTAIRDTLHSTKQTFGDVQSLHFGATPETPHCTHVLEKPRLA